ncbi:glycosyltransferase [Prosthecobacter sp. SYSU 5D2]|uniref:glycosyltransferase n=1 Tax=Prosthecobacter sp. SYSU 5D2 TaxID=3134134 RepID=UPI0031FEA53F
MPTTQNFIDEAVQTQITGQTQGSFATQSAPDLGTRANLDPFGRLSREPQNVLGKYDFDALPPDATASFLKKMDLLVKDDVPKAADLAPANLALKPKQNGVTHDVPQIQHSIWVGQPLNGDSDKKKAFMAQLVENKRLNPAWDVVLWTDQPRAAFHQMPPDPSIEPMKKWAADNKIILASIDEIYGQKDNRMQLHMECKLEQNKGGTGRAAASDIIRLEVLNRFGGIYVDGDKPFKKSLDQIADLAQNASINLPGQVNPAHGFVSASERNSPQNCALCSVKGGAVTQALLDHIQTQYAVPRNQLSKDGVILSKVDAAKSLETGDRIPVITDDGRPQRVEVITRTGPTAIKAVVGTQALMPADALQTFTGTTSWSQEFSYKGKNDLSLQNDHSLDSLPDLAQPNVRTQILTDAPSLPGLPDNIPDIRTLDNGRQVDVTAHIKAALQPALTALCYTSANENGRLDLKHIEPHLGSLNAEEKRVLVHAVVQSLAQPEFAGVASNITSLAVPKELGIAKETMDLLANHPSFQNLDIKGYCINQAALHNDVAFLKYAAELNPPVSLSAPAGERLDYGVDTGNPVKGFATATPLQAAVNGNATAAVRFILSQPAEQTFSQAAFDAKLDALKVAMTLTQPEATVAITRNLTDLIQGQANQQDLQKALDKALVNGLSEAAANIKKNAYESPEEKSWDLFTEPVQQDLADLVHGTGPLHGLNDQDLRAELGKHIQDASITKIQNLEGCDGDLQKGIARLVNTAPGLQATRNEKITIAKAAAGLELVEQISKMPGMADAAQKFGPQIAVDALSHDIADHAARLAALKVPCQDLPAHQKAKLCDQLLNAKTELGGPLQTVEMAQSLGVEDDLLKAAALREDSEIITASLNRERALPDNIDPGTFDLEAETAIAHAKLANSEAVKNDYKGVDAAKVAAMTPAEIKEKAQAALVYSHDRLRDDSTGAGYRVKGWSAALNEMMQSPHVANDKKLSDLLSATKAQVDGMNDNSLKNTLRKTAQEYGGPDLSQREGTSRLGKLRDFFHKPDAPAVAATPAVPGKRV